MLQGRFSLDHLKADCEAANLIAAMLAQKSAARPPMAAVLAHPAWWPPARKLAFLVDLSNAMEFQDRAVSQMSCTNVRGLLRQYPAPGRKMAAPCLLTGFSGGPV